MFEGLLDNQLASAIEALLFVSDEPVSTITLAEMLEVTPKEAQTGCKELQQRYTTAQSGIQLQEVAGGWRLYTHPQFNSVIEKYVISWDTRKLSQAALEVLAIVAYSQPVTRQGISAVRGVNSDSSLNSLVEKGLVREAGSADAPGNPMLYATTRTFLEKFGLKSVSDLPRLEYFAPDEETQELIRQRLNATRIDIDDDTSSLDFDAVEFDYDGESEQESVSNPDFSMAVAQDMLKEALAASLGVTEKIDFDSLVFETDDE